MKINEEKVFEIDHFVTSYEVDRYYHQRLSSYFSLVQESAALHAAMKHCSIPELNKQNKTWMIIRNHMEINKFPLWGDTEKVQTWAIASSSFSSHRGTRVLDERGNICFECKSVWGIIDLESHNLIKPGTIIDKIGPVSNTSQYYYHPKLNNSMKYKETLKNYELYPRISYYDSDYNNHVNNISYLNWILQSIPKKILDDFLPSFFDISWLKETHSTDKIIVTSSIIEESNGPQFIHKIEKFLNKDEKQIVCIAESKWDYRDNLSEKMEAPKVN